jgi:LacI family transcriptional regulator
VEWLKDLPKPIGIMAVDDGAAAYLVSACRHADLSVPEQVAVIGVNNDEVLCEIACTPISSVDAGFTRVGYGAARLLDRLLRGEQPTSAEKAVRLPPLGVMKRLSTDLYAIDDLQLAEVIRYIREHACDPCTVEDVARVAAVGRRNLERRLSRTLGRTPGEEILRVRMETAKRLLLQPDLGLDIVAQRSGFSGMPAFSRAFTRVNAVAPSEFRRNAQKSLAT